MKKIITILTLLPCLFFMACSIEEPSENPDLISKWELMEILENDGDKAVFKPTDKKETIEFLVNEKVRRSTSWCSGGNVRIATYSPEERKILAGCDENELSLSYVIKGNFLLIYPNCIEGCALKYRRIDNLVGFVK